MDHAATMAAPVALVVIVALLSWATTVAVVALDASPWIPILRACRHWPVIAPPWPALAYPVRHAEVLHCSPP